MKKRFVSTRLQPPYPPSRCLKGINCEKEAGAYSYLGGPYTHDDYAIMDLRAALLTAKAAELMKSGLIVFSPITHGHAMAVEHDLPRDIAYWEAAVRATLRPAKELLIYKMDGWAISSGVALEIRLARKWGIPVKFIEAP